MVTLSNCDQLLLKKAKWWPIEMNFTAVYAKILEYFNFIWIWRSAMQWGCLTHRTLFLALCFTMKFTAISSWCMLIEWFFTTRLASHQQGFWGASFTILSNEGRLVFPLLCFLALWRAYTQARKVGQILPCCSTLNFVMIAIQGSPKNLR